MPIFSAFKSKSKTYVPESIEEQEYNNVKEISKKIEDHYQNQIQQIIANTVKALETQLEIEKKTKLNSAKQNLSSEEYKLYEKSVNSAYERYKNQRSTEVKKMYENSDRFVKALFKTNSRNQEKGRKQIELDDRRIDKLLSEEDEIQPVLSEEEKQRQHFRTTYAMANERLKQRVLPVVGGKSKSKSKYKTRSRTKQSKQLIKQRATRKKNK